MTAVNFSQPEPQRSSGDSHGSGVTLARMESGLGEGRESSSALRGFNSALGWSEECYAERSSSDRFKSSRWARV